MSQFHPVPWDQIAAIVGVVVVAFAVFGLLAWSRWLSHKEMMKLAEAGGQSREALRLRERWQTRHGILWAVRVLAFGVALGVFGVLGARSLAMMGARSGHSVDRQLAGAAPLLLIAVVLVVVGAVTLIAYAIWSRRDAELPEKSERTADERREDGE